MRLREKMIERGMIQYNLAKEIGTDVPMVSRFLNYKCLPIPPMLVDIAKVLECEISDLYEDKEIYISSPPTAVEDKIKSEKQSEKVATKKSKKNRGIYKLTVEIPLSRKKPLHKAVKQSGYPSIKAWVLDMVNKLIESANSKNISNGQYKYNNTKQDNSQGE